MTSVSSFSLSGPELTVTGSQATKTVACLHSSNATHCIVLAVRRVRRVRGVRRRGVSSQWESLCSTIAVTFQWKHCGIMAALCFWWKWGSSRPTKGLSPRVFWEFSMSPLGMIQREGEKEKQRLFQRCQNYSTSLLSVMKSHV